MNVMIGEENRWLRVAASRRAAERDINLNMNTRKKHCCDQMSESLSVKCDIHMDEYECPDCLVVYNRKYQEYGIIVQTDHQKGHRLSMKRKLQVVCFAALLLSVCGFRECYKPAGRGDGLPKRIKTLAIPTFQNASLRYKVE